MKNHSKKFCECVAIGYIGGLSENIGNADLARKVKAHGRRGAETTRLMRGGGGGGGQGEGKYRKTVRVCTSSDFQCVKFSCVREREERAL